MAAVNFPTALTFVWQPGYDTPDDGYHVTPGDPGNGTYGGVIEESWAMAVAHGLVSGRLRNASRAQLEAVLRFDFWGSACDALPPGLDLMLFNGRMMSGGYGGIFQSLLGLIGDDVDGGVGPKTLRFVPGRDALTGAHYAYLKRLPTWKKFEGGWTKRIVAARETALALAAAV
jgi:lysozyme family protein